MNQNHSSYYEQTLNKLRTKNIDELIFLFNREVGKMNYVTARGSFLKALRTAFNETSLPLDPKVFGKDFTSFCHPIELRNNRVIRKRKSFKEWIIGIFRKDTGGMYLGNPS